MTEQQYEDAVLAEMRIITELLQTVVGLLALKD